MTNQQRVLLIIIFLCLTATVGFLSLAKQTEKVASPVVNSQDYGSGTPPMIIIDDKSSAELQRALGTIQLTTVLNQIYSEHYKLTDQLDKEARLDGGVVNTSKQTRFNLIFSPSNDRLLVTVDVKNAASNNYDLDVRKADN